MYSTMHHGKNKLLHRVRVAIHDIDVSESLNAHIHYMCTYQQQRLHETVYAVMVQAHTCIKLQGYDANE
jgi:hypothetical protein